MMHYFLMLHSNPMKDSFEALVDTTRKASKINLTEFECPEEH